MQQEKKHGEVNELNQQQQVLFDRIYQEVPALQAPLNELTCLITDKKPLMDWIKQQPSCYQSMLYRYVLSHDLQLTPKNLALLWSSIIRRAYEWVKRDFTKLLRLLILLQEISQIILSIIRYGKAWVQPDFTRIVQKR